MASTEQFLRQWKAEHPKPIVARAVKPRRVTKVVLQHELDMEKESRANDAKIFQAQLAEAQRQIEYEQLQRVSAQRGLVPYVRSLEQFNQWLAKRPALRKQLRPVLRELGLWEIKLGYDPDQDFRTSLVSADRMKRVQA